MFSISRLSGRHVHESHSQPVGPGEYIPSSRCLSPVASSRASSVSPSRSETGTSSTCRSHMKTLFVMVSPSMKCRADDAQNEHSSIAEWQIAHARASGDFGLATTIELGFRPKDQRLGEIRRVGLLETAEGREEATFASAPTRRTRIERRGRAGFHSRPPLSPATISAIRATYRRFLPFLAPFPLARFLTVRFFPTTHSPTGSQRLSRS